MLRWFTKPEHARAGRISQEEWEQYKDDIIREYRQHGLSHLEDYMFRKYQFEASEDQWRKQLGRWKVKRFAKRMPGAKSLSAMGYETISAHQRTKHWHAEDHTPESSALIANHVQACSTEPHPAMGSKIASHSRSHGLESWDNSGHLYTPSYEYPTPQYSDSSRSASPFGSRNSGVSSYCAYDGSKRAASISSQSSAPSSKRFRRGNFQQSVSGSPLLEEDTEIAPTTQNERQALAIPASEPISTGEDQNSASPVIAPRQHKHEPRPLVLQSSMTIKTQITFVCDPLTADPPDFVRLSLINPTTRFDMSREDHGSACKISDLAWEHMQKLRYAAAIFTACKLNQHAFKMHQAISTRLKAGDLSPWGFAHEALLDEALACSRVAKTKLELRTCHVMLVNHLRSYTTSLDMVSLVRAHTGLAEICSRQERWEEAKKHRSIACQLLPLIENFPLLKSCHAVTDVQTIYTIVRAYAFKASMDGHLTSTSTTSAIRSQDEKKTVHEAAINIWLKLAFVEQNSIIKVLKWCREQLSSVSKEDRVFLRTCYGQDPLETYAVKQLNVAGIFGLFLLRFDEAQYKAPQTGILFGTSHRRQTDPASFDLLWIMASLIVEHMRGAVILKALSDHYFESAHRIASRLARYEWQELSSRLLSILATEMSPMQKTPECQQSVFSSKALVPPVITGASANLIMAVVQKKFDVVLEGAKHYYQESYAAFTAEPYYAMSIACTSPPGVIRPNSSSIETTNDAESPVSLSAVDFTGTTQSSNQSSTWQSMKRIRLQMSKHTPSAWRLSLPKTPTIFILEACRKAFGRPPSPDGMLVDNTDQNMMELGSHECTAASSHSECYEKDATALPTKTYRHVHDAIDQTLLHI